MAPILSNEFQAVTRIGKPFPPGVYVSCLTFFRDDETQEIDWEVQRKHLAFLIESGLHGIVLAGTDGEAMTLTATEKAKLVVTAREVARQVGRPNVTLVLGCGGQCTRDVISETRLAKYAGADFALASAPSHFQFAIDEEAVVAFFHEVASSSPIPILICNYPGVSGTPDLSSETLEKLGCHPNIIGAKLTCDDTVEVARIRSAFGAEEFVALCGQSDQMLPTLVAGGVGTVTRLANLFPRACLEIFDLYRRGQLNRSEQAQAELGAVEWAFFHIGINGTKWVVGKCHGYPERACHARRPSPQFSNGKAKARISEIVRPMLEKEDRLWLVHS